MSRFFKKFSLYNEPSEITTSNYTMEDFSTNLSKAEIERLAILIEECAEVQQIACKILRHGYNSYDPTIIGPAPTNKQLLERELGDLSFVIDFLTEVKDISYRKCLDAKINKAKNIQKYLHFNKVS